MSLLEFIDRHPVWSMVALFLVLVVVDAAQVNFAKAIAARRK